MKTGHHIAKGSVIAESWDTFFGYWLEEETRLDWNCIFMLPPWLKAWQNSLGNGSSPCICMVRDHNELIGIAPLILDRGTARLMGNDDLFDYVDFITAPGREELFLRMLFMHMKNNGITFLDTGPMRFDSPVLNALKRSADDNINSISCTPAGRVHELDLPRTWEEYLNTLSGKERHEIRRKIRRLDEAGNITYRTIRAKEHVKTAMDRFIKLFRSNTAEKAHFMDDTMESFFRKTADAISGYGLLNLSFLEIDNIAAAATMCFDYRSTVYIYNNAYDREYEDLSVGLLSKVFSIRDAVSQGRNRYNFLKGDEAYKRRLGSTPVQLYRCLITLN